MVLLQGSSMYLGSDFFEIWKESNVLYEPGTGRFKRWRVYMGPIRQGELLIAGNVIVAFKCTFYDFLDIS